MMPSSDIFQMFYPLKRAFLPEKMMQTSFKLAYKWPTLSLVEITQLRSETASRKSVTNEKEKENIVKTSHFVASHQSASFDFYQT